MEEVPEHVHVVVHLPGELDLVREEGGDRVIVGLGEHPGVPVAGHLAEEIERVPAPAIELFDQRSGERERGVVAVVGPVEDDPACQVVASFGNLLRTMRFSASK